MKLEDRALVIGPSWVGDMVMAQALFKAIKVKYPTTRLDVLAPEWSRPLTDRMPEIDLSLSMPLKHGELDLKKRYQIAKRLPHAYQRSFVLPNSFKSALIPFFAKIPQRIGWRGEWRYPLLNDVRILDKQQLPLMVQRYVALAYEKKTSLPSVLPKPQLLVQAENVEFALKKHQLSLQAGKIISLCPGAEFGASKRWPIEYYAQIANFFIKAGYQIWIFGSEKDKPVAEQINQATSLQCVNLCGKTSLAEAIDLMSLSTCVVSNDSGLMHIAAALNRPVVAIYGSTDPSFTPPLSDKVKIIRSDMHCSPCFKRECPLQHHLCMKNLLPERIKEAVLELVA
ncbi:lipopolysaccharide heptosyltransferase II [Candidatus Berkiella cookevillensis]|uniref:lipopolysaccharide heptosyltransferase II n=1 Tax=Candidatus Berkiella cookevillensis TaxID=437022 RepID=UPI0040558038